MPELTLLPENIALIRKRHQRLFVKALEACDFLRNSGAKEVYLFGSILKADSFGEHSDVDIAVKGLPEEHIYKIESKIEAILESDSFDLVYMEHAPEFMVKSIKTRGKKIC